MNLGNISSIYKSFELINRDTVPLNATRQTKALEIECLCLFIRDTI